MMLIHTCARDPGAFPPAPPPSEAEDFFKKINRNEGFSFQVRFFLTFFLQSSLNPQNYELALQIPENNYKCSPAPWK